MARCEEFARQGCKVYATSRRVETIADFDDSSVQKLALDVTSDESVQSVFNHIIEVEGKVDVVVNNAGLISAGSWSPYLSLCTLLTFEQVPSWNSP